MKLLLRVVAFVLVFVVVFAAVGAGLVYFSARATIDKVHALPALTEIAVPADSASIAEGKRIAMTRGCYNGCHGKTVEGGMFADEPGIVRLAGPNLTEAVRKYSDAELARLLREGLKADGKSMLVMPSEMIGALSDEDMGRLIAYLRSEPQVAGHKGEVTLGPLAYFGVAMKKYRTARDLVLERQSLLATTTVPESLAQGHYLAMTLCSECHRPNLEGDEMMKSPALGMVGGYDLQQFARLMREGVPLSGDTLGLMAVASKTRFAYLTDAEVEAVYRYLHSLGSAPVTGAPAAH